MKNKALNEKIVAKNELPVTAQQVLTEILPLLRDYFVGDFSYGGQGILYRLPNGQRFYIAAREVQIE